MKHRKFDNPHSVLPKVDRGWEGGSVGWGVLGAFGSNQKGNEFRNTMNDKSSSIYYELIHI